jgi:hypothetical protein
MLSIPCPLDVTAPAPSASAGRNYRRHLLRFTGTSIFALAPICPRCNRLLSEAGREGRVLKTTGARWYGGHGAGLFDSLLGQRQTVESR